MKRFFRLYSPFFLPMKTLAYIDGFNLYCGALKGTAYKWLDIFQLIQHIGYIQNPEIHLMGVRYFTSPVKAKIASHGELAVQAQNAYLKALKITYPDRIQIIEGFFSLSEAGMPRYQNPLIKSDRLSVWRLEEKKTDVQLALTMYRDAYLSDVEQLILVSNDTDQLPTLEAIKADFPHLRIGLIIPRLKTGDAKQRPSNANLEALADWTRHYIHENELAECQLPTLIKTKKKPVFKPDY